MRLGWRHRGLGGLVLTGIGGLITCHVNAAEPSFVRNGGTALTTPASRGAASATPSHLVLDFMTMDVCVDASGRVLQGVIPGDAACSHRRDIKAGERAPYMLHNFGYPGKPCADSGFIDKTNAPVVRNGVTRIVSTTIRRAGCSASAPALGDDATDSDGASIQWADDQYGFIMGSYSPVALSAFQSSLCGNNPSSSQRFFRGWVIGPRQVPAAGAAGAQVFEGALAKGASSAMLGSCPAHYRRALTTWTVQPVIFKSRLSTTAIVSSHYAQTAPDGRSPGGAMQMEQTYWTAEFGLSRWEKWTREDFQRSDGKSPADAARQLYSRGRCSPPLNRGVQYTPAMSVTPNSASGVYSQTVTDPTTGQAHRWFITLCEDYTNAKPTAPTDRSVATESVASGVYWAP